MPKHTTENDTRIRQPEMDKSKSGQQSDQSRSGKSRVGQNQTPDRSQQKKTGMDWDKK